MFERSKACEGAGLGADFIIIDDSLKPEEALSTVKRTKVNEWYDRTLMGRLNDKKNGVIIVIMQRLHQDDLVGPVLGQQEWTRLGNKLDRRKIKAHSCRFLRNRSTNKQDIQGELR